MIIPPIIFRTIFLRFLLSVIDKLLYFKIFRRKNGIGEIAPDK